jgi:hypothetical protein
MFDEGENFPALRQILHPFRGKAHPPCGPVQQPHLQVFSRFLMVLVTVEAGERVSAARTKPCFRDAHKHLHSLDTIHLLSLRSKQLTDRRHDYSLIMNNENNLRTFLLNRLAYRCTVDYGWARK